MGEVATPSSPPVVVDTPIEGVVRVRLNRPHIHNALDMATVDGLVDAIESTRAPAVVVSSTAPGVFCSGADTTLDPETRTELSNRLYRLYETMLDAPAVIMCAVDGPAVGGGAQIAIASDLRILGPRASFRFVGAGHGLAVGAWGLPALVGRGRALDLCLTMRGVDADEALAIGLADRVVPDAEGAAVALATEITRLDPAVVGRVKSVVRLAAAQSAALTLERGANYRNWDGVIRG